MYFRLLDLGIDMRRDSREVAKCLKPHSDRARRRASTNLHKSNERCQFKLHIGYWTSNNNKWPKI